MDKHTELAASQQALGRFYQAVKDAGGLKKLGDKIGRALLGKKVKLTVEDFSALACSMDSSIRLGNAIKLNAEEHQRAADAKKGDITKLFGAKTSSLMN